MLRAVLLGLLVPLALACNSGTSDACAAAFSANTVSASAFCATFTKSSVTAKTGLPAFATACSSTVKKLSSACSCLAPASSASTTTTTTTKASSTAITTTSSKASSTSTTVSSVTKTTITTSIVSTTSATKTTTTAASSAVGSCTVTVYASLSAAVKSCTTLLISNLSAPASSTISLKLQTSAVVTFAGTTTFGTTANDDFDPIVITGTDITIIGAPGNVIDGNGPAYWDGLGSNGGTAKPDHFIVVKNSVNVKITGLNIKNWPVHCFSITGNEGVIISNIVLDNSDGDAANSASDGLAAAHNSDGFDISSSDNVLLQNIWVHNQDDCVAVTSGSSIVVNEAYCYGGHGLSIGSVGGKSNNTVSGVTFENSQVVNSSNGARIKTNSGTTGTITDITYSNITLSGITTYGIDIQQDYLNGGPTGSPTNGVIISGVHFIDVTGTATSSARDYYILCGSGSCSDFTFVDTKITGGGVASTCNYPSTGCPS